MPEQEKVIKDADKSTVADPVSLSNMVRRTYKDVCIHGVHYGGQNCWTCHPELQGAMDWMFAPEMDVVAKAYK